MKRNPAARRRTAPARRHWRTWVMAALATVLLAMIAVFVYRYLTRDPDAAAITERIESARQAAIRKDLAACVAYMDTSYTDNLDNNYERVRRRVGEKFDEVSNIAIKIRSLEIEVDKARGLAVAKFEMRTTGKYHDHSGDTFPFFGVTGNRSLMSAGWEKVDTLWTHQNGEWLVTRLSVQPLK